MMRADTRARWFPVFGGKASRSQRSQLRALPRLCSGPCPGAFMLTATTMSLRNRLIAAMALAASLFAGGAIAWLGAARSVEAELH
jgi:hypothetical protein